MDDAEITGRLERVDAQIEALRAAVSAIARSMPNNDQVLKAFDKRAESLRGIDGANPVPEQYLQALDTALTATRAQIAPRQPRGG